MAANTDMSDWIKFFTAAGIPPGPAAKYAVVFLDNRIQKSMLMDLTKEYLKEMGISIMGDIIAILKYAKTAHVKYENERPAITALQANPDAKVEVKRQSTPGNRMLEHYMRKEGIMEGSGSKVTVSPSMAVRLGAVPVAGGSKKGAPQGLVETAEIMPVKRPRMVKPEEEGKYVISMPKGSTPKTQKILQQKLTEQPAGNEKKSSSTDDKKSSVFARLGSGSSSTTSPSPSPTASTKASPSVSTGGSSIFSRLGGKRERVSSNTSDSSVVEYQGVLKSLSSDHLMKTPKASVVKMSTQSTAMKRTFDGTKMVSASPKESLQARLGKPSATGMVAASSPVTSKTLQARLGAPVRKTTAGSTLPTAIAKSKVTVTIGGGVKKSGIVPRGKTPVERLGVQTPEISTTSATHMDLVGVKSKVQDRLGGGKETSNVMVKGVMQLDKGLTPVKRSMQARLGAPVSTGASPTALNPVSTKQRVTVTLDGKLGSMQDRLGVSTVDTGLQVKTRKGGGSSVLKRIGGSVASSVPTKQSRVKERLGVMRAEATSTTPSVTVTLGGGQVQKKLEAADGGKSQKNVFSRLGS